MNGTPIVQVRVPLVPVQVLFRLAEAAHRHFIAADSSLACSPLLNGSSLIICQKQACGQIQ